MVLGEEVPNEQTLLIVDAVSSNDSGTNEIRRIVNPFAQAEEPGSFSPPPASYENDDDTFSPQDLVEGIAGLQESFKMEQHSEATEEHDDHL